MRHWSEDLEILLSLDSNDLPRHHCSGVIDGHAIERG
jgi:hypothetical protein